MGEGRETIFRWGDWETEDVKNGPKAVRTRSANGNTQIPKYPNTQSRDHPPPVVWLDLVGFGWIWLDWRLGHPELCGCSRYLCLQEAGLCGTMLNDPKRW